MGVIWHGAVFAVGIQHAMPKFHFNRGTLDHLMWLYPFNLVPIPVSEIANEDNNHIPNEIDEGFFDPDISNRKIIFHTLTYLNT